MILSEEHFPLVEELIRGNYYLTQEEYDLEKGLHWIKTVYLPKKNNQIMFGIFDDEGTLLSICGLRMNFPSEHKAVISNVFYKAKSMAFKRKVMASEEAYRYAYENGAEVIYSVVKDYQFQRQWKFVCRFSAFLNALQMQKIQTIKALETSQEDWINSMLGRRTPRVDYSVREVRCLS